MNKRKLAFTLLAAAIFATSCKKNDSAGSNPTNATFSSISVNRTFKWNSTKQITLNVLGMSTSNAVVGTLVVSEKNTNVKYYTGLHKLSDNLTLQFNIPAASDSVQIQFGSIKKTYSSKSTIISANYLPTVEPDVQ